MTTSPPRGASGRMPEWLSTQVTPTRSAFAGVFAITALNMMALGATLPVIPRYVSGPLDSGEVAVGLVTGAFAITGIAARPFSGHFADRRGRRPTVLIGSLLAGLAGAMYFIPAGVAGLFVARLVLGVGGAMVNTASATWVVDLAPPERRGRMIGYYGLAIWGGLALGAPAGELLLRASDYEAVWAFAAIAPLIGVLVAMRIPDRFAGGEPQPLTRRSLVATEALLPGFGLALATMGYATIAAFLVLHLDHEGIGHGATIFSVFAAMIIVARLAAGWVPDRLGPIPASLAAVVLNAIGLSAIALASGPALAVAGALAVGAGTSLTYPAFALFVVNRVPEHRRGVALGTFAAFFDLGMGGGAPVAGAAASLGGYPAAFWAAAGIALISGMVVLVLRRRAPVEPVRPAT